MFVNLENDISIKKKEIIGIFNMDTATVVICCLNKHCEKNDNGRTSENTNVIILNKLLDKVGEMMNGYAEDIAENTCKSAEHKNLPDIGPIKGRKCANVVSLGLDLTKDSNSKCSTA